MCTAAPARNSTDRASCPCSSKNSGGGSRRLPILSNSPTRGCSKCQTLQVGNCSFAHYVVRFARSENRSSAERVALQVPDSEYEHRCGHEAKQRCSKFVISHAVLLRW